MRGALRFLLHLAQHLAASQHWAHFALGFLRLFGHTLNVNNFLAGAEREESLKFFLFSSFFVFDFAYDALATCLLDDVHSLNNREKQRSDTKCTQWELCRHTTNDTLCQLARSLALALPHDVCVVCALSLSRSLSHHKHVKPVCAERFLLSCCCCCRRCAREGERARASTHDD